MIDLPRSSAGAVVWQVSGGPPVRGYSDVLLRYGVALIGPGDAGRWESGRSDDDFEGSFVRRFAEELKEGDVIVLRTGLSVINAIGLVSDVYQYANVFDDVNGWDLQHTRRVRWCVLPTPHTFGSFAFGANPPRCARVWNKEVVDFAERFLRSPPTYWQTAALPELPHEEPPLDQVPDALQGIVAQAADLVPLLQDGHAFGEHPSEDELIAHFVVPFLRALGWPPERIAVQWRHIDVAVFRGLPRTPENCHLVIEAKRLGAGVEGALEQAKGYVAALGHSRDVIVTDGIRYRMYAGERGFAPLAYANLMRLKQPAADLFARMKRQ
jgi:hypothetical protein